MARHVPSPANEVYIYRWAHAYAAGEANNHPHMDVVAEQVRVRLGQIAKTSKHYKTGDFSNSFQIVRKPFRKTFDRFIFNDDPGEVTIEFGHHARPPQSKTDATETENKRRYATKRAGNHVYRQFMRQKFTY